MNQSPLRDIGFKVGDINVKYCLSSDYLSEGFHLANWNFLKNHYDKTIRALAETNPDKLAVVLANCLMHKPLYFLRVNSYSDKSWWVYGIRDDCTIHTLTDSFMNLNQGAWIIDSYNPGKYDIVDKKQERVSTEKPSVPVLYSSGELDLEYDERFSLDKMIKSGGEVVLYNPSNKTLNTNFCYELIESHLKGLEELTRPTSTLNGAHHLQYLEALESARIKLFLR